MNATWNLTRTGKTFHSFNADGVALCRDSIRRGDNTAASFTEDDVNGMTDENLTGAYRKCNGCGTKEAAGHDRLTASMAPSTGEGDYLPPAATTGEPAGAPASVLTPAPCGSVDEELRLLRKVLREARMMDLAWGAAELNAAVAEYDEHMTACRAGKDRTWVLSPDNIVAVDDALDAHGVLAKGYWTFNGTATVVCTGLKIGSFPHTVARYGDTVTIRHDGTWTITPAEPRVLAV